VAEPTPLAGVLFDYGDTLVGFEDVEATLVASERVLLDALPAPGIALEPFHEALMARIGEEYERTSVDYREVDYRAVLRGLLAEHGVQPAEDQLTAAVRAQILSWNPARRLHPAAHEVLDGLRASGLRVGYVSNTFDPPEMLLDVIRSEGMFDRVLEDVVGPSREGMTTCLATWFRHDGGDHSLAGAVAGDLTEVPALVDRLRTGS
jgi:FMN phosphatase YigB (HAD superfamily)